MTQSALLIMDSLKELIKTEIANKVVFRKNEIIIFFENDNKAKITTKNVA